eukprot:2516687-Karenia_brevis.AAC.1
MGGACQSGGGGGQFASTGPWVQTSSAILVSMSGAWPVVVFHATWWLFVGYCPKHPFTQGAPALTWSWQFPWVPPLTVHPPHKPPL